ncbi:enoyl-CoA hydratase/isomerase family protein [Sinomonas susongensis]|uniref:enoyl-CoA hydratase/isomerase family protein n=1 Tax=Sinomonas susongensis TaxID=1324851 RepID=UPI001107F541|nr:enoyl-CoA hydratase-related protein [Sinomonas susongensis]
MSAVEIHAKGRELRVTLNRPERRNAINADVLEGLAAAAARAAEPDIRVVVLEGSGSAFCAGADLGAAGHDGLPGPSEAMLQESDRTFSAWEAIPVPVVAAVHGAAIAGGLELLLCCDIVVASEAARFADAHARFGLLPGAGGSYRLPRRVGQSSARLLLYTGEEIDAAEAYRIGLVDMLVHADELVERVGRLAGTIASRSPLVLREMKRLSGEAVALPVEAGLQSAHEAILRHRSSEDYAEGLQSFIERREPRFTGR